MSAVRRLASRLIRTFRPALETLHGYEHPELVEVVFQKTLAFDHKTAWPEIAGASSVLDFGGGCGFHHKQANLPDVRWAVVETHAMVQRARELETNRLRFFTSISEASDWLGGIDVMHSNGALQYTSNPEQTLSELCSLGAKQMLWYRAAFSKDGVEREVQSSQLGDNGPGRRLSIKAKTVRYAFTKIPESDFLLAHEDYKLLERGPDWFRFELK